MERVKLRYQILSKKARKEALIFRPTIFYDNQIDCINVGPGTYNTEVIFEANLGFEEKCKSKKHD